MYLKVLILFVFLVAKAQKPKDVALIVSGAAWHHEVILWAACSLKSMGLSIHAMLNIGFGGRAGFSPNENLQFHTMCTDRIIVLPIEPYEVFIKESKTNYTNVIKDYRSVFNRNLAKPTVKLMVFITFQYDLEMMKALNIFNALSGDIAEHSMWISHNAFFVHEAAMNCRMSENCTIVHLADHVNDFAMAHFSNQVVRKSVHAMSIYPVVKHPMLRDVDGIYLKEYKDDSGAAQVRRSALIAGSTSRRDFGKIFKCMSEIHSDQLLFDLTILGNDGHSDKLNGKRPSAALLPYINRLHSLSNDRYYEAVANSSFLATFLHSRSNRTYDKTVATSCIPTALMSGIPVVTTTRFLNLYPCLRSSRVHRLVAHETDCDSLRAAVKLSPAEYHEFRREAIICRDYFARESQIKLNGLMRHWH